MPWSVIRSRVSITACICRNLQLILANTIDRDQLRLEDYTRLALPLHFTCATLTQDAVAGNRPYTSLSISPVRLDRQLPLLTRAHIQQALVPTLNHLSLSDDEAERLSAVI